MDLKTAEKTLHLRKLQFARGELTIKQFREFADQTLERLGESFAPHAALIKMISEEYSYLRHEDTTKQEQPLRKMNKPVMTVVQFQKFLDSHPDWTNSYGGRYADESEALIYKRSLPNGLNRLFRGKDAIVPLDADSVFVDLGSGYGLVVAQIALTTGVGTAVGVEVVPEYALKAREVAEEVHRLLDGTDNMEKPSFDLDKDDLTDPKLPKTIPYLQRGTVFYITNKLMQNIEKEKVGYADTVEVKIRKKLAEVILECPEEEDRTRTRILVATDPLLGIPAAVGAVGSFTLNGELEMNCRLVKTEVFEIHEIVEWVTVDEQQKIWIYEFGTQIEDETQASRPMRPKRGRDEDSGSSSSASSSATIISAKKSKQTEPEVPDRELFDEGSFTEDESMWRKSIRRQIFQLSLNKDIELIYMNTLLYEANHFMWTQRVLQLMDIAQVFAQKENEPPLLLALMPSHTSPKKLHREGTDVKEAWELTRGINAGRKFGARAIVLRDLQFSFLEAPHRSRVLIIENLSDAKAFFEMVKQENLIQELANQRLLILLDSEEVARETAAESEDPYNMAIWAEGFEILARDQTQKYRYDTRYVILRSKKLSKEVEIKLRKITQTERLLKRAKREGSADVDNIEKEIKDLRAALTTKYQKE